ncbi:MAG TPA: hypothetical protein VG889_08000 [Rhizomicrobium sp.]|nr:hypothetical protein [Rhizomicrobium sp.]
MNKTILLASVAALALCAGGASAAGQHPVAHAPMTHGAAKFKTADRTLSVLYDQNDDAQGFSDTSQNFESSLDAYDNQGADDFTVPDGVTWKVSEVDVSGLYFKGSGPASGVASSENVTFYKGTKKGPKTQIASVTATGDDDGLGNFVISLGKHNTVKLKPGHYWVSVQANMDFFTAGQWGWATRNTQGGIAPAMWQNPGGGFGLGCTTWSKEQDCLGDQGGVDHMFTLRGKVKER